MVPVPTFSSSTTQPVPAPAPYGQPAATFPESSPTNTSCFDAFAPRVQLKSQFVDEFFTTEVITGTVVSQTGGEPLGPGEGPGVDPQLEPQEGSGSEHSAAVKSPYFGSEQYL